MLGYDLDDERREERPRETRSYDAEDEPVDVEGDSLGWPDAAINIDGNYNFYKSANEILFNYTISSIFWLFDYKLRK